LFARLSAGPATEEFDSALRALRSSNFPDADPPERAAARKLIARHRWYLDVVRQYGQAEREAILVVIFMCSVIPDLADEQVLAEIAHWAGPLAAPDPVINALYQATDGMVGAQLLMSQALEPVLAQRWRLEHHVHVPAAIPSPVQDAPPGLRDQGTGPQRAAASQGAPPPAGPQPPPATVPPAGAQAAMSQAPVRPPINAQWLLGQLEGNWSVPRALVLAACIAFIVLIVLR
jgi:hypothetical protein